MIDQNPPIVLLFLNQSKVLLLNILSLEHCKVLTCRLSYYSKDFAINKTFASCRADTLKIFIVQRLLCVLSPVILYELFNDQIPLIRG